MPFSRANPSPRYVELVKIYKDLHENGDKLNDVPAEDIFYGKSIVPHMKSIGSIVESLKLRTLLDYGCGKAGAYEKAELTLPDGRKVRGLKNIWGVDSITLYDPGYAPHRKVPTGSFDGVICTDVLEHCPEEDIDWIIDELFGFAERFLFCTVACHPASKQLPNGDNAHITIKNPSWWTDKFAAASAKRPVVKYFCWLILSKEQQMIAQGGGAEVASS